jgi:hypothetical protein
VSFLGTAAAGEEPCGLGRASAWMETPNKNLGAQLHRSDSARVQAAVAHVCFEKLHVFVIFRDDGCDCAKSEKMN